MSRFQSKLRGCARLCSWTVAVFVVAGSGAVAQDPTTLNLQLTLPAFYNNNFGLTRKDAVDGLNATPGAQLTLAGGIWTNLDYVIVAATSLDRYDKTGFASDEGLYSATLIYKLNGWKFKSSYGSRGTFDPGYGHLQLRLDDLTFGVEAPAIPLGAFGSLSPIVRYRERSASDTISSNHSPSFVLGWTKTFDGALKGWTAEAEFSVRYLDYDQRDIPARDWVTRQDFTLSRELIKDVLTLQFNAAHAHRTSNILERHYDNLQIGSTLVFSTNIF